jgi:hypothetical protein
MHSLGAVTVVLLAAFVPPAFAGEAGKGADPAKAAALAHFETARRQFDVREYGKALEEYKAAYVAKPDPAFLFNIGQCPTSWNRTNRPLTSSSSF